MSQRITCKLDAIIKRAKYTVNARKIRVNFLSMQIIRAYFMLGNIML